MAYISPASSCFSFLLRLLPRPFCLEPQIRSRDSTELEIQTQTLTTQEKYLVLLFSLSLLFFFFLFSSSPSLLLLYLHLRLYPAPFASFILPAVHPQSAAVCY
ncbi:hypothetical protein TRV_00201 [Trichophyton verrucosum HKI 0517]|uniref:Uncharacterized protein n=1 Tax=Trichophyton verrucosum (strain HKI 0517) TaxID=663202 RepID=D4CZF9_TRIVH|nr:uncharacterized protein TRV_00201 [Trichophyton verrucosum HKI 0517]EFE45023.1 hypothetical protein TRV_00201 [Trichophyton verrucosum HKI 0517]